MPLLKARGEPVLSGNQKEGKMERHYETVCIVKPDIGEDAIKGIITRATSVVEDNDGKDVLVDEWGRRKLAYPIQKKNEGFYFVITYTSPPPANKELERILKLNEDVLRYQTVGLKVRVSVAEEPAAEEATEKTPGEETEKGEGHAE